MSDSARSLDRESAVARDEKLDLKVWLRLLTCSTMMERQVRAFLRDRFDITLARFDLMAQLDRATNGMTMGELSNYLMVTNGNVTGLIDRMASEGLVERVAVETDRRSQRVRLTPAGRAQFAEMAPAHRRFIESLFSDLGRTELRALYDRLGALKQAIPKG